MSQRIYLLAVVFVAITLSACGSKNSGSALQSFLAPAFTHADVARAVPIIDLHCDTLLDVQRSGVSVFDSDSVEVSLPHVTKGLTGAQFFAAWIAPENASNGFARANQLIDAFYKLEKAYQQNVKFSGDTKGLEENFAAHKFTGFLGIEGGEAVGTDINNVNHFFNRGVRYMTLTWNSHNAIADAAQDNDKPWKGLSPYGEKVVQRMNDLGMMVDVSHGSDDTVRAALKTSRAPIIASHSNAYALRAHFRNLKDELIKGVCDKGGVIGINFYDSFLTSRGSATSKDIANHIDYIAKIGGVDCVALGSDYDGGINPPTDLPNPGEIATLTKELINRHYTQEQIEKIYSRNVQRILATVAAAAVH